jgi:hypothetical protein
VALLIFILDFGTVPRVWHYLFLYGTLELFREYGILCFDMGLWDYSHSVALLMYLLDFGTDKSNIKINNATLSEQLQSPTEK